VIRAYIYARCDVKCQLLFDYIDYVGLGLKFPIPNSEKIVRRFSVRFIKTDRGADRATSVLTDWSSCCVCGSFKNKSLTVR
jgi:hypothetical protein